MKKLLSVAFLATIFLTACSTPKAPTANDFQKYFEDTATTVTDEVKAIYTDLFDFDGMKEKYDKTVEEAKGKLDTELSKLNADEASKMYEDFNPSLF